jgi:RNA polymerase sigma factor (sigma-70 family)
VSFRGSISHWIEDVKAGCDSAATSLWSRYHAGLMRLAGRRLKRGSKAVVDEEDIALGAFHSFLRRCREGDYPHIRHRDDLWRLLVAITIHKANNQVRDQRRLRRDVRRQGTGDADGDIESDQYRLEHLTSPDPPASLLATLSDSLNQLFSRLPDGELRSMVLYKLEGYTNREIAEKLGRSRPTIERRLRLIREIWREEFDE